MKIDDLNKLDWREDTNLRAIERKLSGLSDLESQARKRSAELQQAIQAAEASLVQARVARMLDETSGESEETIHAQLSAARQELDEVQADLEATKLVKTRLAPSVAAAASEARLRVACQLLNPYREATEAMQALLKKAIALNQFVHAVHAYTVQHGLGGEIAGNKTLKPLTQLAAWNALSDVSGRPSGGYTYWDQVTSEMFR